MQLEVFGFKCSSWVSCISFKNVFIIQRQHNTIQLEILGFKCSSWVALFEDVFIGASVCA